MAASTAASQAAPDATHDLQVRVTELRNSKGMVHACLTREPEHFPNCKGDANALRLSVAAAEAGELRFTDVPGGSYALSIIHDENGNGKLDTFAGIPREGYGFSGNPPMRFGPPKFDQVRFTLAAGQTLQQVRVRYLL